MKKWTSVIVAAMVGVILTTPAVAMQSASDLYLKAKKESIMFKRVELYTEALEQDATLVDAHRERGILYYYQGKYQEAVGDLTAYIENGAADHRVYLYRALAYLRQNMPEKALEDLSAAHRIQPKDSEVLSHRARVYYDLKRFDEARRDADQVLRLHDDPASMARALNVQARIYADQGHDLLAREHFKKAAALDPTLGLFRVWAGYLSPEQASRIGLMALIVLPVVLIFRLSLPKPKRKDDE
jgi:tetratricopeptide (TPR) repeat protein